MHVLICAQVDSYGQEREVLLSLSLRLFPNLHMYLCVYTSVQTLETVGTDVYFIIRDTGKIYYLAHHFVPFSPGGGRPQCLQIGE